MIRRQFLKHLAAGLPSLPLIFRGRDEYVHPLYGKYQSHHCDRTESYMECELLKPRTIIWPVVACLVMEFDKVKLSYTGFNASKDLCDRINLMRPGVLLKDVDGDCLVFTDRVGCVREVYPELKLSPVELPVKFFVREVSRKGKL